MLGAAAAGAGVSLLVAAGRPCRPALVAHERAVDVGLSTQSLGPWLGDVAHVGGDRRRAHRLPARRCCSPSSAASRARWWMPGAGAVVVLAAVFTWLAPVVLAPLFNDFEQLPEGSERARTCSSSGDEAGVEIGEVYRVDASRRVDRAQRLRRRASARPSASSSTTT